MMGMGFGMGFGILGLLFMLVFWGGLILLAVWLVRALFSSNSGRDLNAGGKDQNARQILDQRYARGEIDREEFQNRKRELGA